MKQKLDFLKVKESRTQPEDFFETFFRNQKNNIYGWGPAKDYSPGIAIFQQDTPADNVYFIERGLVKLSCLESGGRLVIICLRRRHWLLGAPAAILEKPYAYTATTLTPCSLLAIPVKNFLSLVEKNEKFYWQLFRMLSKEIYNHGTKVMALGLMPAKERLKKILYEMILEQEPTLLQKQIHVQLPLLHKELAQLIAITPEHLCRLLREMEQQGIIKRNKGLVVVKDPSVLLK
jgi:CRP-like cAMP-binding protein